MRAVIAILVALIHAPASFAQNKVDPTVKREIETFWGLDSTAKLPTTERVDALASLVHRELRIEPPIWWRERIAATLNDRVSSASPRVKRNAQLEQRGNPPNHKHVIVMNDGRKFAIETLDGDWSWELEFANVYKHKSHVYVLNAGGCLNPYPVYKVSTNSGKTIWKTTISGLPWVNLMGGAARHETGLTLKGDKLVVFGYSVCGGAYAFAINDSNGKLLWQFDLLVHGDQDAPLFGP